MIPDLPSKDWDSRSDWSAVTAEETDLYRGLVVQSHGPEDVSALDYLAHRSRADTTEIDA